MRLRWIALTVAAMAIGVWMVTSGVQAQVRGQDANVAMMDNCAPDDPAYDPFGGCPEGAPFSGSNSFKGDVTAAEFFALFFSPLAPGGQVIGHPSWRNEPSYVSIRDGRTVHVSNQGGRAHTFTEVANFGGGFIGLLNGALLPAPECANPAALTFVEYGGSEAITGLDPGLHKFQCCIHPWMRAAVRVK
jgi:plastocyanin